MSTRRVTIFPLSGAVLFPGLHLPLHIFEPRYRAMVQDALARDRRIGMIQPSKPGEGAPLYAVGCLGKIAEVEALDDGRFNIVLEGESRFRIVRELDVTTPFRQVEAELLDGPADDCISAPERADFERSARIFAEAQGFEVDWQVVERMDDASVINMSAQIAPFNPAAKQALLEADSLSVRTDLLVQLMDFFALRPDDGEGRATLQ